MENEKRLIDANALLARLASSPESWAKNLQAIRNWWPHAVGIKDNIVGVIKDMPTVDAVGVVHGHWKEYLHSALVRWKDGEPVWADRSVFRCSRCDFGTIARHNYCPRCGAKMDGDGNE